MRKFYSIVLMAIGLLIGTQVQATNYYVVNAQGETVKTVTSILTGIDEVYNLGAGAYLQLGGSPAFTTAKTYDFKGIKVEAGNYYMNVKGASGKTVEVTFKNLNINGTAHVFYQNTNVTTLNLENVHATTSGNYPVYMNKAGSVLNIDENTEFTSASYGVYAKAAATINNSGLIKGVHFAAVATTITNNANVDWEVTPAVTTAAVNITNNAGNLVVNTSSRLKGEVNITNAAGASVNFPTVFGYDVSISILNLTNNGTATFAAGAAGLINLTNNGVANFTAGTFAKTVTFDGSQNAAISGGTYSVEPAGSKGIITGGTFPKGIGNLTIENGYTLLPSGKVVPTTSSTVAEYNGTEYSYLEQAFAAVPYGEKATIKMLNNATLQEMIVLAPEDKTKEGAAKDIVLDLNGCNIECASLTNMFTIYKGSLEVTGKGSITNAKSGSTQIFMVYGSVLKDSTVAYSRLIIDEDVTLNSVNYNGVVVDVLFGTSHTKYIDYLTNVYKDGTTTYQYRGIANGVRIDIKGDINAKKYAIKSNGYLVSYGWWVGHGSIWKYGDDKSDYTIEGETDNLYAPHIHIYPSAKLVADATSESSTAVYSAGYAHWYIEGECEGNIGLYVKSGEVVLHNAIITSTNTDNYSPAEGKSSGIAAAGSAVIVESNSSYAGDVEVKIEGDTKITADKGFAVEEVVTNTNNETKVSNITIDGGTFEGGDEGCVTISNITLNDEEVTISVNGGTYSDDQSTRDLIDQIINGEKYTEDTQNAKGNDVFVVTASETTPTKPATFDLNTQEDNSSLSLTNCGTQKNILNVDKTLDYLGMTSAAGDTVIVSDNKELVVNQLVMSPKSQIIVRKGGTLKVEGKQGIVAPNTGNIIIEAQEGEMAQFLFAPEVVSNKTPNATVEFIVNSYTSVSDPQNDYRNQRFGIPTTGAIKSITAKNPTTGADVQVFFTGYINNEWSSLGYLNVPGLSLDLAKLSKPFQYYQMQCNAPEVGTKVTFTGEVVGNTNPTLVAEPNQWVTFANSYSANMDCSAMLGMLDNENVSADIAVYTYTPTWNGAFAWKSINYAKLQFGVSTTLAPMQAFIIKNGPSKSTFNLNYKTMVWDVANGSSAPKRQPVMQNCTKAVVSVSDQMGQLDEAYLLEADQFSTAYENGYDAEKFMNENVNLYITSNKKQDVIATDMLDGTYLGFACVTAGEYTLTFGKLEGANLELVDNVKNVRVPMTKDAKYTFTAGANEANDYRFQIRKIANQATDVETVMTDVKVGGIYTITGLYVGSVNEWNNVAPGVYVVDGVKRVK